LAQRIQLANSRRWALSMLIGSALVRCRASRLRTTRCRRVLHPTLRRRARERSAPTLVGQAKSVFTSNIGIIAGLFILMLAVAMIFRLVKRHAKPH